MTAIASFSSSEFKELKVWVDNDNREYYRAIDVCYALKHSNPSQALSRLVDADFIFQIEDGSNRAGKVNYLSEPGLYQLIFSSKTEQAKRFQRWVFTDVLPKLRSQGIYVTQNHDESLADYEAREKALIVENKKLLSENQSLIEANQDGSMVHLKLVFLFRRALQDLRELRMWHFETKREKQIYEALKGMSEMMDSLFGSNDMSLKDWDELKSDLNNKKLDNYAQTLLHASFEEYIGNWATNVKLTNKIVGRD